VHGERAGGGGRPA